MNRYDIEDRFNRCQYLGQKAYFFGFSRWKHQFTKLFFDEYKKEDIFFINPIFSSYLKLALKKGLDRNSNIYIWGRKSFPDVEAFAKENNIDIYRVEDGFIRSVGLGSDLTQPYSLVVDKRGIYFDPNQESDLEYILQNYSFDDTKLIEEAQQIKEEIIKNKISKYNSFKSIKLSFPKDKIVALVVGQVEDDASIKYGANSQSNLDLLRMIKKRYPDRYIVYKPHPDVKSGNRVGSIDESIALKYCHEIVNDTSMASVLNAVDEVHTLTSLTGFEGLIYGKKVYTYGVPFYAGWGLTIDALCCKRRTAKRTLEELIAATYILYPRYISINSKKRCSVFKTLKELSIQREKIFNSQFFRMKFNLFSRISRFFQKIITMVV